MILIIGPCFPVGPLNVLALLFRWLRPGWLQGQHARLIPKPGELIANVSLLPRPQDNGGPER